MALNISKDYLRLHFIVLIWGFTGILGKLIPLPATELVCYRMFWAAVGILAWALWKNKKLMLPLSAMLPIVGVGCIVALHWVTFFAAIKVSNVAVAVGCMASATLFTAFIEPIIERKSIFWIEFVLGFGIIIGLYIITQFALQYYLGIILALVSAFLASLFGVLNKLLTRRHDPIVISAYEMMAGFVAVFLYTLFSNTGFTQSPLNLHFIDVVYLLILAFACTSYAFVTSVDLLKTLSAYTVAIAINLEPVYSIILAYFIFGDSEKMNLGFYLGTLFVLSIIWVHPILDRKFKPKNIE